MKKKQFLLINVIFIILISTLTSSVSDKAEVTKINKCKTEYYTEKVLDYKFITVPCVLNVTNKDSCINGKRQEKKYFYKDIIKKKKICTPIKYKIKFKQNNYNIDFSENNYYCESSIENNCKVITCISKNDGYHEGEPIKCTFGATCQKFVICDNEIKELYKHNSNEFKDTPVNFYQKEFRLEKEWKK